MSSTEERLTKLETQVDERTQQIISGIDDIKKAVKQIDDKNQDQDLRLQSLEQSRSVARKVGGWAGVPLVGGLITAFLKTFNLI